MQNENLEQELADELDRSFTLPNQEVSRLSEPQKRSMVPHEHLAESLLGLEKALKDTVSLRDRLIGPVDSKVSRLASPAKDQQPIVSMLHSQANEVARLAQEIAQVIAQIREKV